MSGMRVVGREDLEKFVKLGKEELARVEEAFIRIDREEVQMPPIQRMDFPKVHGEIDVKSASFEGVDGFTVKMSTGFFDNPKRGLATGSGLMVVFSADTGMVKTVLLDGGYLTHVRTALAGAAAVRALAPPDEIELGVIGTGDQARYQTLAVSEVRRIKRLRIWGRSAEKAGRLAADLKETLGLAEDSVEACAEIGNLVSCSEVVVTCTPATRPLITESMLGDGRPLLIVAMGSDAPDKNEVAPGVLYRAERVVVDSEAQCRKNGELHHAPEVEEKNISRLGRWLADAGGRPGKGLTVVDLTGTGAQDNAIANYASRIAEAEKLGIGIDAAVKGEAR